MKKSVLRRFDRLKSKRINNISKIIVTIGGTLSLDVSQNGTRTSGYDVLAL